MSTEPVDAGLRALGDRRAAMVLRAKAAELENRARLLGLGHEQASPVRPSDVGAELGYLAADVALVAELLANLLDREGT